MPPWDVDASLQGAHPERRRSALGRSGAVAAPAHDLGHTRRLSSDVPGRGASLDLASSCGLDLAAVGAKLSAPALSFDCGQGAAPWAEEEEEGAAQAAGLEVCAPRDAKARSLMNSSLRQQISSVRVRQMLQRGCAPRAAGA
ncbi:unnamed protein product [Prorocentrum cordatum]|uniref:Uncharacterized protein n=1 Tax=Prorocentrum cordatum TaxID=2364126 RepID=A0ABN9RHF8_9DINO|nr:unnamed protein product [Polarella glacialis]